MKFKPIILACFLLAISFAFQNSAKKYINPFLGLKYDKVIAYDYNGQGGRIIINNGNLSSAIKKVHTLTNNQINKINQVLGDTSTYGGSTFSCFDPHLGLVYYLDNKIIAHVSICLSCNFLSSSIKIPAIEQEHKKIKVGENHSYFAHGFTELGSNEISKLCKELQFSHCKTKYD